MHVRSKELANVRLQNTLFLLIMNLITNKICQPLQVDRYFRLAECHHHINSVAQHGNANVTLAH